MPRGHAPEHVVVRELLRCEQQELEPIARQVVEGFPALDRAQPRVQGGRRRDVVLLERVELILLERDQRRHDDRLARKREPGDLVDRRLPGARRHDDERVATGDHRLDGMLLLGPELEAKRLPSDRVDIRMRRHEPAAVPTAADG